GRWVTSGEATDPDYWVRHLRHTVRFSDGVRQLLREPSQVFLEVGPGRTLGTLIGRHPECTSERLVLGALRHRHDPRDDAACLLEAVGRLWLAGACRKPAGFYAAEKRRRVPLPTYPFERRRFWLDPPAESAAEEVAAPVSAAVDEVVGDWFYLPAWNPRRAAGLAGRDETGGASWLLFLDAEGVGGRLAERLRGQGRSVATVVAGAAFERLGDGAYALDSRRPEDYDALLGGLAASGLAPRRIVHLWSVAPPAAVPLERWEDAQRLGFYSLLFLAQALGRRGLVENLRIDVVSSHMQQVAGGELSCPEKAPLLGLVRVAPKEYPGIRWRSIDLAPPAGGSSAVGSSQDLLLAEILSHDPAPVIAIRGDVVWEQAFAARHLPAADAAPARLREGGTYLISGGLGSMGLVLARYLAKEVRARLVLIGRTELPPEAEWDGWLRSAGLESETVGAAAPPSSVDFDPAAETELVESLESRAKMEAALTDVDGDERLQALLHGYCSRLIGRYFAECGVELAKGYTYGRNELRRRLRVLPRFEKFLAFLLRALAEDGIVRVGADGIEVLSDEGRENPAAVREVILAEYPKFQGLATFLEHCTARYAPALSGEIRSISVLYPDGTPALLDQSGRDTPAYAGDGVYLETAARLVARLADKPAGEKLRILEV
ncbi:MAG: KR prefix domain-containing protein, partial [Gammaproteobacteria bacterium]